MTNPESPEAYIAATPDVFRALLERIRAELAKALPDAEEAMMYGMPGFRIEGEIVAGYAAFARQCGLYVDPAAIVQHADEIAALKLKASKTGVTFTDSLPIPDELIAKLAASSRRAKGL